MLSYNKSSRCGGGLFSWIGRRGLKGDAPVSCLIIIAVVIGGLMAGYYFFWKDKSLDEAGTNISVKAKMDPTQTNNYRIRVRDKIDRMVRQCGEKTRSCLIPITKGKVTAMNDELSTEMKQLEDFLRETIDEVNSQSCTNKDKVMHTKYAVSVGENWKALKACRKSFKAENKKERDKLLEEARHEMAKAKKDFSQAHEDMDAMFKRKNN